MDEYVCMYMYIIHTCTYICTVITDHNSRGCVYMQYKTVFLPLLHKQILTEAVKKLHKHVPVNQDKTILSQYWL